MGKHTPARLDANAIRVMEPVIVDRLRLAFPSKIFGIERVPSTLSMSEYKRVLRMSPFIGLAWVGFKKDGDSGRILKGVHQWRLTMVVRASNGLEARFKGDHSDVGLDAMVDIATALLQGAVFDEIGFSTVTDAQSVFAQGHEDDDVALAHVNFEIAYSAPLGNLELKTASDFDALQITWLTTDPQTNDGDPDISQIIETPKSKED